MGWPQIWINDDCDLSYNLTPGLGVIEIYAADTQDTQHHRFLHNHISDLWTGPTLNGKKTM